MAFKNFYLYGLDFVDTPRGMEIRSDGSLITTWYYPEEGLHSQEEFEKFAVECWRELSPRL